VRVRMSHLTSFREYEIAVADILRSIVRSDATVEHDRRLPGQRSGTARQVDVLVHGRIFGLADATLIVDCKLWSTPVDVADVGTFLDLVEDVGADFGVLVTSAGYSRAAQTRARAARGIVAEVVTLDELEAWSPRGTASASFRVAREFQGAAEAALAAGGFRVRQDLTVEHQGTDVVVVASRHYGKDNPTADEQRRHLEEARDALEQRGVPGVVVGTGITISGGTPGHRWLEVADREGQLLGLKVLAASEEDIDRELSHVASTLGLPRSALDVVRPTGWPFKHAFRNPG
jgi:Restriction endonuclease